MKSNVFSLVCKVAGVTYEDRQSVLRQIARANSEGRAVPCRLRPEPDNAYDLNAVAVDVSLKTEQGTDIKQAGYIPAKIAVALAPHLRGENLMVSVEEVNGGFETYDGEWAALGMRVRIELPMVEGYDYAALRKAVDAANYR